VCEVSFCYQLFGFRAASNIAIPGLAPGILGAPDLSIFLGCRPTDVEGATSDGPKVPIFTSSLLTESGCPALKIFACSGGTLTHLVCHDGMEFWLDKNSERIWGAWPDTLTLGDAATYLLGPVLGLFLRRKGLACLHASAVVVQNGAVLFTGDAGAGKSTTAAAMARRGHAVLADDIVAITERDGEFFAAPAYPYVSLWPESAEMLFGSVTKLASFSPTFAKQQLPLGETSYPFQEHPLRLSQIFILSERSSGAQAPSVERLSLREGLLALVANSYATNVLDEQMRATEFRLFGRIMQSVPVQRLRANGNPDLLDRFCDVINASCGTN
jgi:hypothetical protein